MPCVYLPGPAPAVTVANSLFITGNQHQKTTWLWIMTEIQATGIVMQTKS